jgi:hypothetical protein
LRSLRRVLKLGAISSLSLCLVAGGCGNTPVALPDLGRTAFPAKLRAFAAPGGDVTFSYPQNWALIPRDPPGVATVASGGASITVWAYRAVAVVKTISEVTRARDRLLASLKRDPSFTVLGASVYPLFRVPAVEIDGRTEIGGRRLGVRSVHVYRGSGEYVVDMLADPTAFNAANIEVLQPLLLSLRVFGRPPVSNGAPLGGGSPSPAAAPAGRLGGSR